MKFTDFIEKKQIVAEAEYDDWRKTLKDQRRSEVIAAIDNIKTLEDASKIISYGNLRVPSGEDGRTVHHDVKEFADEEPEIFKDLTKKINGLITNSDDMAFFVKNFFYTLVFDDVLHSREKEFVDFFVANLKVDGTDIIFMHDDIKHFPKSKKILMMLIERDPDLIEAALKEMISALPTSTVKFEFAPTKKGWIDGRNIIKVEDGFVPALYRVCLVAYAFDEFDGDSNARTLILKSPQYKSFARSLKNEIKRMLTITEANLYLEDYEVFLNSHALPEFFRALRDFVCLLEDAHMLGKHIFAWFYHLPRHGQMHKEKKDFLSVFTEVFSRSNIGDYTNLTPIFDNGEKLSELAYYD